MSLSTKLKRFSFRLPQGAEGMLSFFLIICDMFLLDYVFRKTFYLWLSSAGPVDLYIASYNQVKWYLFAFYLFFGTISGLFRLRSLKAASDIIFHTTSSLLSTFIVFNLVGFMSRSFAALSHNFPRPIMLIATAISIVAVFLTRIIISRIFREQVRLSRC